MAKYSTVPTSGNLTKVGKTKVGPSTVQYSPV